MFFSNIAEYSNKKLSIIYWCSLVAYFCIMLVGPFFIIADRYQMFHSGKHGLTAFGICILLAFLVIGLRALKAKFALLPENTVGQRRLKFTIQLFYSLALPIASIFILYALWADFDIAFATIRDSLIFVIVGILVDNLIVKYVESERTLRYEAQRDKEKAKRMNLFK